MDKLSGYKTYITTIALALLGIAEQAGWIPPAYLPYAHMAEIALGGGVVVAHRAGVQKAEDAAKGAA